jgi:hypothetical protein
MNVLILTDFSIVAQNAGKYAVHFLGDVPVNFYLLNIQTSCSRACTDQCISDKRNNALGKLNAEITKLQKSASNSAHTFSAIFSSENLVNTTRKYVGEKKIDLIVMGAAGRDVQYNAILGSHTYDIIRKIKCTVLAVPEGSKYREIDKIVLPIDFSAALDNKIFGFFENPGICLRRNITVLEIIDNGQILPGSDTPRQLLSSQLNKNNLKFIEMEENAIYDEILLTGIQKNYDMIVILGKNLSVCERLLHTKYGICTAISNELPILVLHG